MNIAEHVSLMDRAVLRRRLHGVRLRYEGVQGCSVGVANAGGGPR